MMTAIELVTRANRFQLTTNPPEQLEYLFLRFLLEGAPLGSNEG
jgi:hypothetical protein